MVHACAPGGNQAQVTEPIDQMRHATCHSKDRPAGPSIANIALCACSMYAMCNFYAQITMKYAIMSQAHSKRSRLSPVHENHS